MGRSHYHAKYGHQKHCGSGDMVLVGHVISQDYLIRESSNFFGKWYSASGAIIYLICHLASKEHMIEGSYGFMGGSSSFYVTNLPSLLDIRNAVEMFLVCHIILQENLIKVLSDFMGRISSM